ncbi:hypothetical protein SAMN07250955_11627 [Arboricoccus pini]|uniref:Uncharacterized protein n=1 Tax=Arboricoccus pini TaxID=1963835 RepID=A0A212RWM4_9PROT|nr:hypothetical protein SAMN07250955_11627 [Arboricoccus pini]
MTGLTEVFALVVTHAAGQQVLGIVSGICPRAAEVS